MTGSTDVSTKGKYRNWTFTIYSSSESEDLATTLQQISLLLGTVVPSTNSTTITYLIIGQEVCPKTGRKHLQGYMQLNGQVRLTTIKKMPLFSTAHLEGAKGSDEENHFYCSKEGNWQEFGVRKEQGRRTDLERLHQMIKENKTLIEIAEVDFGSALRFHRGIGILTGAYQAQIPYNKPQVIVRYGAPGVGKTRYVFDNHEVAKIWTYPGLNWFDGYFLHEVALLDDYEGDIPISDFKRLLDRYPISVRVKTSHVAWRPKIIYITSNISPQQWYNNGTDRAAIWRRLDRVTFIDENGIETEMK